jgi:predicted small secreted protein
MARSITRPLLAALLALAAALALAGCGGGGGGGKDISAGLTAQQLLDRSSAEAAKLQSFRIAIDGTGRIDLAQGAGVPGASLLNGPITVSGEGPVQPPDRASIDAKLALTSLSPQVNLTRVGDEVFVGVLGQDFRVALPPSQVALFDFGQLYPTLAGWVTNPVEAGREDVGGSPTVKVTGGVDAAKAFADLAPLLQAQGAPAVAPAKLKRAVEEGTVEAWIGTEDLRPRRVHIVLKADGSGVVTSVRTIDVDLTATLSAFDEPVDIQAPRNPRQLDLTQLGSLAGG